MKLDIKAPFIVFSIFIALGSWFAYANRGFLYSKIPSITIFGRPIYVKSLNVLNLPSGDYKTPCVEKPFKYNNNLGEIQKNIGYQNNKFGLYIYAEEDYVIYASDLVNSNGGDWGYVLIPINVKDYESQKWNKIFALLEKYHLIPIMQLWDLTKKEEKEQIYQSAYFLNSLKWPIRQRFVSVYNEPNDDKFWRDRADPVTYAEILRDTIRVFKSVNPNFFMLNGAFNASARGGDGYMDEEAFLIEMDKTVQDIFKMLDGWASHPYPQPNFTGSPQGWGRDSVRAYEWELGILEKNFGVKNLPIFITEAGWPHQEGEDVDKRYLDQETVANYYKTAFENVWLPDDRIVAVTPFTIKYPPPDDHFSWLDADEKPYLQYKVIQSLPKTAGLPPFVIERGEACD
ncbi:hypothetical protein KKF75_00670 [Patescibacteria group bacterium]|nr:hypothetical protein [Patescibacteria group bacterium]